MARVTFGAMVTDIVGSIGGFTFQSNRSGKIIRLRGRPSRSSTTKQTEAHQAHIKFLQIWQTLTLSQKQDWDTFATTWTKVNMFGQDKVLTGLNFFESINFNRVLVGESTLSVPPAHSLPVAVGAHSYAVGTEEIEINFDPVFNPADNALLIYSTPLLSKATTSFRQYTRLTKVIDSGPYDEINIKNDWENTHGTPWPPGSGGVCGSVGVVVRTLDKNSGLASTGSFSIDSLITGQEGVGFWIIEFDFEVQ